MTAKVFFLSILLAVPSFSFAQHVVLLMNEEKKEMIVLKKKNITDIITLSHEYVGDAEGISLSGIQTQRRIFPIDSVHSFVVKRGNFGKILGLPLKLVGIGLGAVGGLVILSSKETKRNDLGQEETSNDLGQLATGATVLGVGAGLYFLGTKSGDRKIEKDKTTYYLSQWKVKITHKKNIRKFKNTLMQD